MARGRRTRAETRARYYIRQEAEKRGWNLEHVARGGHNLEENEIAAVFPDIGLGLDKPDFLMCLGGAPAVVVEAKNETGKLSQAIGEAVAYADRINAEGAHQVNVAVGAAGEQDAGFNVEARFLTSQGWVPLESYGHALTAFPSLVEVELALKAADGTTTVSVPAPSEFVDAAIELSNLLRAAKIEAPLRPKVMGAVVMAMYEGKIDVAEDKALDSVNALAEKGIRAAVGVTSATKDLLAETLRLTTADFDRLAPSIRRVVSILRRLNVRSVLQTDTDFLGTFYEAFLRYGYDNNALGIVFTPRHTTGLCVDLVGVKPKDKVIDVASGTGGFLVAAFDRMMARAPAAESVSHIKESTFGFEVNPTVWALAVLNMFFRGDGKAHLERGSCLTAQSRARVKREFTRAFLNPPFSQEDEPEIDFIDAAMDALEPDGMLAAIVYAGVFADDPHRGWRKNFLRRHTLVGMVSLPEDLFYPTAAPTSIIIARAHIPMKDTSRVLMTRIWNDGFEKLKSRRVERAGSQLPEIVELFRTFRDGGEVSSPLSTEIKGENLKDGAEWSPQQYLPQPAADATELLQAQEAVLRSLYQAVAQFPDLADEALGDFTESWSGLPDLPTGTSGPIKNYFAVFNGRSTGEKNYAEGSTPYISSGDSHNSIIRLVSDPLDESFAFGGISVTAFGAASLQPWPFVARGNGGSSVRVLEPRFNMSVRELLWFAAQINLQRWRFFYARMSIKGRLERLTVDAPPARLRDSERELATDLRNFQDGLNEMSRLAA
ncbi:MAG TPA: N-6 DNA methylase [Solirubrobacteraceae bacterium]|jgi:type I restriction-modification system DNA methylase subunit|nr:N-6 DNA methylase [Solirubrobacteraceae bacterium]